MEDRKSVSRFGSAELEKFNKELFSTIFTSQATKKVVIARKKHQAKKSSSAGVQGGVVRLGCTRLRGFVPAEVDTVYDSSTRSERRLELRTSQISQQTGHSRTVSASNEFRAALEDFDQAFFQKLFRHLGLDCTYVLEISAKNMPKGDYLFHLKEALRRKAGNTLYFVFSPPSSSETKEIRMFFERVSPEVFANVQSVLAYELFGTGQCIRKSQWKEILKTSPSSWLAKEDTRGVFREAGISESALDKTLRDVAEKCAAYNIKQRLLHDLGRAPKVPVDILNKQMLDYFGQGVLELLLGAGLIEGQAPEAFNEEQMSLYADFAHVFSKELLLEEYLTIEMVHGHGVIRPLDRAVFCFAQSVGFVAPEIVWDESVKASPRFMSDLQQFAAEKVGVLADLEKLRARRRALAQSIAKSERRLAQLQADLEILRQRSSELDSQVNAKEALLADFEPQAAELLTLSLQ